MKSRNSSRIPGFKNLSHKERLVAISEFSGISLERLSSLLRFEEVVNCSIDSLIENCIGSIQLPIGIAPNFKVNQKDYLVPMAVEESSVVAAAAFGAKLAYRAGGFLSQMCDNLMIGQTQFALEDLAAAEALRSRIETEQDRLILQLNSGIERMVRRGGGVRAIYVRGPYQYRKSAFVIVQFDMAVEDAMGANVVNATAVRLGELLNDMADGRSHTCILSNLATKRVVRARCRIALADMAPESEWENVGRRIELTQGFAEVDPFRASTHNKGIMNGVDAVLVATGNDWRANEAGAYGFAALGGRLKPLSHWHVDPPYVFGEIQLPIQVGIVGGVTRIHPTARLCLDILGVQSARELAELAASVGLAQNFSAIRALAFEGIQHGHMRLHASNLARHDDLDRRGRVEIH